MDSEKLKFRSVMKELLRVCIKSVNDWYNLDGCSNPECHRCYHYYYNYLDNDDVEIIRRDVFEIIKIRNNRIKRIKGLVS